jgi:hypothetical protein
MKGYYFLRRNTQITTPAITNNPITMMMIVHINAVWEVGAGVVDAVAAITV